MVFEAPPSHSWAGHTGLCPFKLCATGGHLSSLSGSPAWCFLFAPLSSLSLPVGHSWNITSTKTYSIPPITPYRLSLCSSPHYPPTPLITTGKSMSCTRLHLDFPLPRRTGSARTSNAPCLFPPACQCSHLTWHLPEAQGTFPCEARKPSCPSGEKSCPFGSSAHTSAWSVLTRGHPCLEKVTDGVTNARSSTQSGPHSLAV